MQMTSSTPAEHRREESQVQEETDLLAQLWSPRIVYLRADISDLASPLLPFAVFKENPLIYFHAARETVRTGANDEIAAEAIASLWHQPFAALADVRRYFLVAWSAVPHLSERIAPLAELAFGIATPGLHYKRWITTCAVSHRSELVAWCIEIDMLGQQEEAIEIVLTRDNMQRLSPDRAKRNARVA